MVESIKQQQNCQLHFIQCAITQSVGYQHRYPNITSNMEPKPPHAISVKFFSFSNLPANHKNPEICCYYRKQFPRRRRQSISRYHIYHVPDAPWRFQIEILSLHQHSLVNQNVSKHRFVGLRLFLNKQCLANNGTPEFDTKMETLSLLNHLPQ